MGEKLKPCPFCGGVAYIEQTGNRRQSTIYECESCGCRLETGEEFSHGKRWNERSESDEITRLRAEVAALAEQNAKMRKALTKWRYLDGSYNWRCGHCGNEVEDGHKEGCALSLPDLASPVLNRIRAEGMREAEKIVRKRVQWVSNGQGIQYRSTAPESISAESLADEIRACADELEKTND